MSVIKKKGSLLIITNSKKGKSSFDKNNFT